MGDVMSPNASLLDVGGRESPGRSRHLAMDGPCPFPPAGGGQASAFPPPQGGVLNPLDVAYAIRHRSAARREVERFDSCPGQLSASTSDIPTSWNNLRRLESFTSDLCYAIEWEESS